VYGKQHQGRGLKTKTATRKLEKGSGDLKRKTALVGLFMRGGWLVGLWVEVRVAELHGLKQVPGRVCVRRTSEHQEVPEWETGEQGW